MDKLKVLLVFGTRPEAVKMAPLIKELKKQDEIITKVCVTGQHREMLDQILHVFDIVPDYDLNIFKPGQTLTEVTHKSLVGVEKVIKEFEPDLMLVQGDTTAVFAGALAAFYNGVKIGHVEAGLRSGDLYSPFPEEANRMLTGVVTNFHFAPTNQARENLFKENYDEEKIFVTGNTAIDALHMVLNKDFKFNDDSVNNIDFKNKKVILMTAHRRENIGENMENIFGAIKEVVESNDNVEIIYPMHKNPKVREIATKILGDNKRIHLTEPIDYLPFAHLMAKSYLIVTDSGGIQEEAPSLGKPVLVVRKETERPEGIEAGTARLIGVDKDNIVKNINKLVRDEKEYEKMAFAVNPYGDGTAAKNIVSIIKEKLL
ncbi:UDP-N-acetylglucosamine 2-epimerase (non-hydrolyzing) [Sedimentibacter sp. zth1]|uniref:non-hydrolyzing UDP-N-acetylglucosamine 2-epimerase n=1 Tax=Sedimentibacter sp. zth1 TaxID=2816908 RepID=UPI001A91A550|nr:UDP-N-acetylglucosamine 2-epimerase (non-hydrolyzing) [Sedimentibacter sp. zth1]QSX05050.1 UDP-N-acetylglucosamine 2-epimerase (non-hydrolyzing) [Sedimentibacter sp. zth1]